MSTTWAWHRAVILMSIAHMQGLMAAACASLHFALTINRRVWIAAIAQHMVTALFRPQQCFQESMVLSLAIPLLAVHTI